MPMSAEEHQRILDEKRRPGRLERFRVMVDEFHEAALNEARGWFEIPLDSDSPDDVAEEVAREWEAVGWKFEITEGSFGGRMIHFTIPRRRF